MALFFFVIWQLLERFCYAKVPHIDQIFLGAILIIHHSYYLAIGPNRRRCHYRPTVDYRVQEVATYVQVTISPSLSTSIYKYPRSCSLFARPKKYLVRT